jgi:hypothetical protein
MTKRKALTEAQWLASTSGDALLCHLEQHVVITRISGGRRLLRLFCCACCREAWHLFTDQRSRRAVELAEQFADGRAGKDQLRAAWAQAREVGRAAEEALRQDLSDLPHGGPLGQEANKARFVAYAAEWVTADRRAVRAAQIVSRSLNAAQASGLTPEAATAKCREGDALQCALLRDIFGNPFRPRPTLDREWLEWDGGLVRNMARSIYDERAFDRLPVLADALEDAGCADQAILAHCRAPGRHARGCWVLEEYLQHYHKRSNIETTISAIKRKFGGSVMSTNDAAMVNEVLCKLLCQNLTCLIEEQEALGIVPVFWKD